MCCWLAVVCHSVLEAFQLSELRFSSDALHSCTRDDQNRETEGVEKRERTGGGKEVTDFLEKLKRIAKSQLFFPTVAD